MDDIDFLEHGGGPLVVRHRGDLVEILNPRETDFRTVLAALSLQHVPGTPHDMPEWKRALVFDRWRAAWELPDFQSGRRLAYLVGHYRAALSHDLMVHAGLDLGTLWRERRWLLMLDIIDRLPAHSWYAAAVASDEEHTKMLAEAIIAKRGEDDEKGDQSGPPLTSWTPEVAALTSILDAVRGVQHAVVAVQSEKGKAPEPPKPAPRPVTPLERALKLAEYSARKTKHDRLAARLLPHKSPAGDPVH